jgi:hypothetical protein
MNDDLKVLARSCGFGNVTGVGDLIDAIRAYRANASPQPAQRAFRPSSPNASPSQSQNPLPPAPNATVVLAYTIQGTEVRDGIQKMYNSNVRVNPGLRVYLEPYAREYTGWVWANWSSGSTRFHGLAPQNVFKLDSARTAMRGSRTLHGLPEDTSDAARVLHRSLSLR